MAVSNTFLATVACIITQIGFGGYGIVLKMFAEVNPNASRLPC